MNGNSALSRVYATLRSIYEPKYIVLNLAAILVYYYVFMEILAYQGRGLVLIVFPIYLLYLLVITSSIALTVGIYSIRNTRNNEAKEVSTGLGTATTLIGGVIGGCGCSAPLIFDLSLFGLSATQTFALYSFVSANQTAILALMIAINLFVVLYYLDKLSRPSCKIRKR